MFAQYSKLDGNPFSPSYRREFHKNIETLIIDSSEVMIAYYSIHDNHKLGTVGDYLKEVITDDSRVLVVPHSLNLIK